MDMFVMWELVMLSLMGVSGVAMAMFIVKVSGDSVS
jgi:hypothetical protein